MQLIKIYPSRDKKFKQTNYIEEIEKLVKFLP